MKKHKRQRGDDLTIEQRRALLQVKIRAAIEQVGCFIMCVFGDKETPPWAYSIGITTTFPGTSEIILFGLDYENMGGVINAIVAHMREGKRYEAGKAYDGILRGLPIYFGEVGKEHYDAYVGQGIIYHKGHNFSLVQCVWSDTQGKFPWQPGF